jgi:hypothetical protein
MSADLPAARMTTESSMVMFPGSQNLAGKSTRSLSGYGALSAVFTWDTAHYLSAARLILSLSKSGRDILR